MQHLLCPARMPLMPSDGSSVGQCDSGGKKLVLRIDESQLMAHLGERPFDNQMGSEMNTADVSSPEEYHGEAAGVVGEGDFEAGDLLRPGLNPDTLDATRDPDVGSPCGIGDRGDSSEGAASESFVLSGFGGDSSRLFQFRSSRKEWHLSGRCRSCRTPRRVRRGGHAVPWLIG